MQNTSPIVVSSGNIIRLMMGLMAVLTTAAGCAVHRSATPIRIVLIAPFEGEDRAIGYEALYAARLALIDSGTVMIDLLPLDDGESNADERAAAIARDPAIMVTLILGEETASIEVQAAFGDLPTLWIGGWATLRDSSSAFALPNRAIASAGLRQRLIAFDAFAPPPTDLAAPVFEATVLAIHAAQTGSRSAATDYLNAQLR